MGGYTLWARKTLESEIFQWKPKVWFHIWFYIVNKVNWKDGQFPRGTGYMTYDDIKVATHATQDQVKHCIEYLKIRQMIATQKATRGMVVTVLNYELYQDPAGYESHTESQLKATQKPHRSHTIIKEGEEGEERETKEKTLASAPKKAPMPKIFYCFESREWKNITEKDERQWRETYPACDIEFELKKMGDWMVSNPIKAPKSNYRKFISNWLSRSQDRGGTPQGQASGEVKGRTGVLQRWADKQEKGT